MPERRLCRGMLTGLDLGRSSAMNKWVAENGKQSAIYAICVMLWLLTAFVVAVIALAVQLTMRPPASVVLWVGFAVVFALAVCRYAQSARARRRFREATPDTD